ncbi:MAG TPA: MarR family transcriptional regulator [Candidatus Limnocylindria bacterium]|nr:MarR family transcriptional regulator [Candidatus Limnocylindria bacterium]
MTAHERDATAPTQDVVDRMLKIWKTELPDLDLDIEGIVERIQKLNKHLDRALNETLANFQLDRGEWWLLGALRRSGPPYRRSPGHLAQEMGLSSGAMTKRLDRLETAGLVRRLPDPNDRRSLQVELTEAGWQMWQDSVSVQAQKEQMVASALSREEKEQLNTLLRRLMLEFERQQAASQGAAQPAASAPPSSEPAAARR